MSWLLPYLLPYVLTALVPAVVHVIRRIFEVAAPKLPGTTLLAIAAVLGEIAAQIPAMVSDIPGLPPGTGAAFAVFVREVVDQSRKLAAGDAKPIGR